MSVDAKDFPIQEVVAQANAKVAEGHGRIEVYQKWTCQHCGSRQAMETPNTFYRSGICDECKQATIITHCNYLAHIRLAK